MNRKMNSKILICDYAHIEKQQNLKSKIRSGKRSIKVAICHKKSIQYITTNFTIYKFFQFKDEWVVKGRHCYGKCRFPGINQGISR